MPDFSNQVDLNRAACPLSRPSAGQNLEKAEAILRLFWKNENGRFSTATAVSTV